MAAYKRETVSDFFKDPNYTVPHHKQIQTFSLHSVRSKKQIHQEHKNQNRKFIRNSQRFVYESSSSNRFHRNTRCEFLTGGEELQHRSRWEKKKANRICTEEGEEDRTKETASNTQTSNAHANKQRARKQATRKQAARTQASNKQANTRSNKNVKNAKNTKQQRQAKSHRNREV